MQAEPDQRDDHHRGEDDRRNDRCRPTARGRRLELNGRGRAGLVAPARAGADAVEHDRSDVLRLPLAHSLADPKPLSFEEHLQAEVPTLAFVGRRPGSSDVLHEREVVGLRPRESSDLLALFQLLRSDKQQLLPDKLPGDRHDHGALAETPHAEPDEHEGAAAPIRARQLREHGDSGDRPEGQPNREEDERAPGPLRPEADDQAVAQLLDAGAGLRRRCELHPALS